MHSWSPVFWKTAKTLYLESAAPRSLTPKVMTTPVFVSIQLTRCCVNEVEKIFIFCTRVIVPKNVDKTRTIY